MQRTSAPGATPADDDAELVARARAGDTGAFELIAGARIPGAWRLARAILDSDEQAADAVANTLVAAWRELPRLDPGARFDDWLDRILVSECRMRLAVTGASGEPAGTPPPGDLLARTMDTVRSGPPRPFEPAGRLGRGGITGRLGTRTRTLAAWVAALAVVIAVGVWAAALVVPRLVPPPGIASEPAPVASQAPGPDATAASTPPPASGQASPTPATGEIDGPITVGAIAMVTLDGDNLRVRSTPGVSDDTTRLKPTLPAGTRMLVVGGPVSMDGYQWWEVQTDRVLIDLFGWVAEAKGETPWIARTAPRCFGALDVEAVVEMASIDFLACHGTSEVRFQAEAAALWDHHERKGDCGWVRAGPTCETTNGWLLLPDVTVRARMPGGVDRDVTVALPPDLAAQLAELPRPKTIALTVSMDTPDSRTCAIRDAASGDPLLSPDQAITACRLHFVVQAVELRQ